MHQVYCISDLGADYRIFNKLAINNCQLHFIKWELPATNDNMRSYALKLAKQIVHEEIILIGVSFGGMLASEISRQYQTQQQPEANKILPFVLHKTILISSCKQPQEFPVLMRVAGAMGLHRAVPYHFMLRRNGINRFLFDLRSKDEELYLKRLMLEENNTELIKRSINIILTWKQPQPVSILHIHGSADRLLLPGKVKADYWVKNGGHFMVWNRAEEVSGIINSVIDHMA